MQHYTWSLHYNKHKEKGNNLARTRLCCLTLLCVVEPDVDCVVVDCDDESAGVGEAPV